MRKTKIVATIGPATSGREQLKDLSDAGMDVARQNFSHGSHEEHLEKMEQIRSISDDIGIMMDTQGPEIRLGEVEDDVSLEEGQRVDIVTADIKGTDRRLSVDYEKLLDYIEEGDTLLIDDGQIELKVEEINESISCRVIFGGPVYSKKSLNVPGKDIGLKAPTQKDVKDVRVAARNDFDFVATSFVKTAEEIEDIREIIESEGSGMNIIAKIEHLKAVDNFESILKASDGIMIARGDLGVEVPASDVPLLQKQLIEKANRYEKPIITATQMLKSMTESPRATRAEVSDVANAVMDGSDAVMLSEETAIGKFPIKTIRFMSEVVEKMEDYGKDRPHHTLDLKSEDVADIIARNVWQASRDMDIEYIVAHTSSGYTANKIAKFRPSTDIIAFTNEKVIQRQLSLLWGVTAFHTEFPDHVDEMICNSGEFLYQKGIVEKDDTLLLTAGVPAPVTGITNMMEIRTVKSLLEEGEKEEKI